MTALTAQGKESALAALKERLAKPPVQVDNSKLPVGSVYYYYCDKCGWFADVKPGNSTAPPKRLCIECQALKDLGWSA